MKIEINDNEAIALIKLKKMLNSGNPNVDEFFNWLADRLVNVYLESDIVDFVLATKRYANNLKEIRLLLDIDR